MVAAVAAAEAAEYMAEAPASAAASTAASISGSAGEATAPSAPDTPPLGDSSTSSSAAAAAAAAAESKAGGDEASAAAPADLPAATAAASAAGAAAAAGGRPPRPPTSSIAVPLPSVRMPTYPVAATPFGAAALQEPSGSPLTAASLGSEEVEDSTKHSAQSAAQSLGSKQPSGVLKNGVLQSKTASQRMPRTVSWGDMRLGGALAHVQQYAPSVGRTSVVSADDGEEGYSEHGGCQCCVM